MHSARSATRQSVSDSSSNFSINFTGGSGVGAQMHFTRSFASFIALSAAMRNPLGELSAGFPNRPVASVGPELPSPRLIILFRMHQLECLYATRFRTLWYMFLQS